MNPVVRSFLFITFLVRGHIPPCKLDLQFPSKWSTSNKLKPTFLCPAFPFPFLGVSPYGTSFGYLRVLPIGLPLASSTPADSYRWCLLAAHTSFLSVINNC